MDSPSLFRCVGRWSGCFTVRLTCFRLCSLQIVSTWLLVVHLLFSYTVRLTATRSGQCHHTLKRLRVEAVSSTCLVRTRRPDGLPSDLGPALTPGHRGSCSACLTQPSPLLLEVRVHQSCSACLLARRETRLLEVYCHASWKSGSLSFTR